MPERDDSSGVATQQFHIHEADLAAISTHLPPQCLRVDLAHGYQGRLAGFEPNTQEGHSDTQELVAVGIEESLVMKLGLPHAHPNSQPEMPDILSPLPLERAEESSVSTREGVGREAP